MKKAWKVFTLGDDGKLLSGMMPDKDDVNNIASLNEWVEYQNGDVPRGFSVFGIDKHDHSNDDALNYYVEDNIAQNNYEKYKQLLDYVQKYGALDPMKSSAKKGVFEVEVDDVLDDAALPVGYDNLRDFPEEYQVRKMRVVNSLNPTDEDVEALLNGKGSALARFKSQKYLNTRMPDAMLRAYLRKLLLEDNIRASIDRMYNQPTTLSDKHIKDAVSRRF